MVEAFQVKGIIARLGLNRLPGRRRAVWTGVNDTGVPVSSGVYFCRMTAPEYEKTIKLTLLK